MDFPDACVVAQRVFSVAGNINNISNSIVEQFFDLLSEDAD